MNELVILGQIVREEPKPDYIVQPLVRAMVVLRYIAAGNRCRNLSLAAKETGVNRTTLIRLLATFEAEGMIEALPDEGGYSLGTQVITLAAQAINERGVVQVAAPVLDRLAEELKLSAHLGILEGSDVVYLARHTPRDSYLASTMRVGTRLPAHATTLGRILLAQLPPEELRTRLSGKKLAAFTINTKTTMQDLAVQLAEDRASGISWSEAHFEAEIGSAAAVVHDHRGQAVASINVTGQVSDFAPETDRAAQIRAAVLTAARDISRALGNG